MIKKYFKKQDIDLLKQLIPYAQPYKYTLLLNFIFITLGIGFGLILPFCFGKMVASVIDKDGSMFFRMIIYSTLAFIVQNVIVFIQERNFCDIKFKITYKIRKDMFVKVLDLPIKALDKFSVGELISRLHRDSEVIANLITERFLSIIVNFLRVLIIGFTAYKVSWKLFLIILIAFPINMILFTVFGKILRKENEKYAEINDLEFAITEESLAGGW